MKERINEKELSKLKLLLTFDIYLRENAKSRPVFAENNGEYKEEIKAVAKYLGLRKDEHIEVLSQEQYSTLPLELISKLSCVDIKLEELIAGNENKLELADKNIFVIFDYTYKNVITNQCKIKVCRFV